MKSQLSTKSLRKLKAALPKQGIAEIASRLGISEATVSRALSNKNLKSQADVVACALALIEEQKRVVNQLERKIKSL